MRFDNGRVARVSESKWVRKKIPKNLIKYIYAKLKNSHARNYTAAKSTSRGLKINTTRLGKFSIMLLAFVVNNVTLPRLVTQKRPGEKLSIPANPRVTGRDSVDGYSMWRLNDSHARDTDRACSTTLLHRYSA